jgi:hypothetical protein
MAVFRAIALMMEAARTSETLVNFYQTTWRYNPKDSHLRTHRRENLKYYHHYFVLINPTYYKRTFWRVFDSNWYRDGLD